jgi:integrase
MASITTSANGFRRIQFYDVDKSRKTIHLGKCSERNANAIKTRVESLLESKILGTSVKQDDATWLAGDGAIIRQKLAEVGLCQPLEPPKKKSMLLSVFLTEYLERNGKTKKPGTLEVWKQVIALLNEYLPNIDLADVTKGHAKKFHEDLKGRGLASTTIHKRIGFARQFFEDAVDWELIPSNPFNRVKTQSTSLKSNVEVTRETIVQVMKHCDPTWQLIIALSRFGGLRCPSETLSLRWSDIDWEQSRMSIPEPKVEHHEGRGVRSCPIFPELRPYLDRAWVAWQESDRESDFVIDKPAYREAANTGEGWKNANLRTQFIKKLRKAGIAPWKRLFHSMRASRQTELEKDFPLHVVCSWLGNTEAVAKKSYLLVSDCDFEKAIQSRGTKTTLLDDSRYKNDAATVCNDGKANAECPMDSLENEENPVNSLVDQTEGTGLEQPAKNTGKATVSKARGTKTTRNTDVPILEAIENIIQSRQSIERLLSGVPWTEEYTLSIIGPILVNLREAESQLRQLQNNA